MKTTEYIKIMENLGYSVKYDDDELIVLNKDKDIMLNVDTTKLGVVDTGWNSFRKLSDDERVCLLEATYEYITTPVRERTDDVKYKLRLPHELGEGVTVHDSSAYLNLVVSNGEYVFDSAGNTESFITEFTKEEIDKIDAPFLIIEEVKE